MTKISSEIVKQSIRQASNIHKEMDRVVSLGSGITWPQILNAINSMRYAENAVNELVAINAETTRNISTTITEEMGQVIDVQNVFSQVLAKGLEFTAEAKLVIDNNNTRESYEEDGKTNFREVTFTSPTIDNLIAIAVEVRSLVQDFAD